MAPGSLGRAVRRYPFLFLFIVGALLLTVTRPCFRRIPAPPPVTGRWPALSLTDAAGRPVDADTLRGEVWVVWLYDAACGAPCDPALAHLRELAGAYDEERVGSIRILSIVAGGQPGDSGTPRIVVAGAGPEDAAALAAAIGTKVPVPAPGRLAIVDRQLNLRGSYAADTTGFDEVYNRAQHVAGEVSR
ncbi:MAG TPA: hypothetical protein VJV75_10015 [Candidatus Polarisedimenticolia bacterium]|nr:hypothetical protein [Candidatus Polarisedimenticolia bacterium]